jgi:GT2 family glycosyltransferase
MNSRTLSWVTVAHHSAALLGTAVRTLRREAAADGHTVEIVVVDHSEDPAEKHRLERIGADRLLGAPNRGYAAGLNSGLAEAGGDILLVGNPDLEWQPGALAALLRGLESFDIVGPQFVLGEFCFPPADEQSWTAEWRRWRAARSRRAHVAHWRREVARWQGVWSAAEPSPVPNLSGALLVFRRPVLTRLGPWDESYFLYFEETEWLRRARRAGLRLGLVPAARIAHRWGHAADPRDARNAERFAASRRLFYRRHYGPLGAWLTARRWPAPPAPWPPLAELPAEAALWLASPSPWCLPAAGAWLDGARVAQSLEELARQAPALGELTVARWSGARGAISFHSFAARRAARSTPAGRQVRPATPEDDDGLAALYRASFQHSPSPGYWSWKYRQFPGRSRSMVAVRDGEIVAHAGALAYAARIDGRELDIWTLVDFMGTTAGAGLRPPLVAAGRELLADLPGPADAPWIFGFPSSRHFRLGERSFGYEPLLEIAPLTGDLPDAASPASLLTAVDDRALAGAEELAQAADADGVRRSLAFLDWRYWARPERYYRFYRFGPGGADGFAVFAFHEDLALAAEWWLREGTDQRAALLDAAADLRSMGLRRWSFWPPREPAARAGLESLGLRPSGPAVFVGIRAAKGVEPQAQARRFRYRMGDYDLV